MNHFDEQEYTKDFDFSLWKKLFHYISAYRKSLLVLVLSTIALAVGDAAFPLATKYALDNFIEKRNMTYFVPFVFVYIGLIAFQSFNVFNFIHNAGKIETGITYDIRNKGFKKLQELSFSYYDTTPVGWIMARMTSDAQRIGDVIAWGGVDLSWGIALIIIDFTIMFIIEWRMAIIMVFLLPPMAVVSFYFQKKIFKNQRLIRKANSKITGSFNEGINGAKTTKTLIREQKNFDEFAVLTDDMRNASVSSAIQSALYMPIMISIGSIGVSLIIYFGSGRVIAGSMGIGTLSLFVSYVMWMFEPIRNISRIFAEIQSAQASAERTLMLIETEPDIVDKPEVIEKYGDAINPKTENFPPILGDIEFKNVSFSYKTGEKVLEEFSLHVKQGERIALVGETGAGKSTIVNLVCRFYEPTTGELLIDGVDYRERSQHWIQSNLGYVLQTPHLFSGTIMENIRYSKLDATDDEVIEAAKQVNAFDFIMKLEKGFQTDVGEGGNRLSSGEKQLVSFARAILSDPRLFVLDEATSSIDTETEQIIQKSVEKLLQGRTSFIVAHRLSTIRSCDRILLISEGRILESGTHKQLLKLRGHYYELYTNQFKREAEKVLLQGL